MKDSCLRPHKCFSTFSRAAQVRVGLFAPPLERVAALDGRPLPKRIRVASYDRKRAGLPCLSVASCAEQRAFSFSSHAPQASIAISWAPRPRSHLSNVFYGDYSGYANRNLLCTLVATRCRERSRRRARWQRMPPPARPNSTIAARTALRSMRW